MLVLAALVCGVVATDIPTARPAAADGADAWVPQTSGTSNTLISASCPSISTCYVVGWAGTIINTTDGGSTWASQTPVWASETPVGRLVTATLNGVDCASTTVCVGVGNFGIIYATTTGGTSWTPQASGTTTSHLHHVSCPSLTVCYAVGDSGLILATTNAGATWTTQTSGTSAQLEAVSCPTALTCYVVGSGGTIRATTDGGTTWTSQTAGTFANEWGLSCPSITTCYGVTNTGAIFATTDSGTTWTSQTSPTSNWLHEVSCPSATECYAAGATGKILATTNGGNTWTTQTSGTTNHLWGMDCPSISRCWAVGDLGTTLAGTGPVAPPENVRNYVAMGDSYSSGEGLPPYEPGSDVPGNGCHRSLLAYPNQVTAPESSAPLSVREQTEEGVSFDFVACSGAKTTNVDSGGEIQPGEPGTQLDQEVLDAETDLVTVTIGGNDAEFGQVVGQYCGRNNCLDPSFRPVDNIPFTDWIEAKIASLDQDLRDVYTGVGAGAPLAVTAVLGYPRLFPDTLAEQTCFKLDNPIVEWSPEEQDYLNDRGVQLNAVIGSAAGATGDAHLGVAERFTNHEVCAEGGEWIHGPSLPISASFHPNAQGHAAYAATINEFLADGTRETASAVSASMAQTTPTGADLGSIRAASVQPRPSDVVHCGGFEIMKSAARVRVSGSGYVPNSKVQIQVLPKDSDVPLTTVLAVADESGSIDRALKLSDVPRRSSLQIVAMGQERDGGDLLLWEPVLSGFSCDDPTIVQLSP